jgi:hypothetical protein
MIPLRTLYHYSTELGLRGILREGAIWASEIRHLNDTTEFYTALHAVAHELRNRIDDLDSSEAHRRHEALTREFLRLEEQSYFVVSLTEKPDDLSQWRAYGGLHTGFAIGFDIGKLEFLAAEHGFVLSRCLYSHAEHGLMAAMIVDEALAWLSHGARMTQRRCREFRRTMTKNAPLLKNHHFHDESEWRLVLVGTPTSSPKIRFHAKGSAQVPYYNLPIFASDGSSPLSSITIGPTPDAEAATRLVADLLRLRGLTDVHVDESDIPLRTW